MGLLVLVIKMFDKGDSTSREEKNQFFMFKAKQQQFEQMNVGFGKIMENE